MPGLRSRLSLWLRQQNSHFSSWDQQGLGKKKNTKLRLLDWKQIGKLAWGTDSENSYREKPPKSISLLLPQLLHWEWACNFTELSHVGCFWLRSLLVDTCEGDMGSAVPNSNITDRLILAYKSPSTYKILTLKEMEYQSLGHVNMIVSFRRLHSRMWLVIWTTSPDVSKQWSPLLTRIRKNIFRTKNGMTHE